jgi:hypothetical protein
MLLVIILISWLLLLLLLLIHHLVIILLLLILLLGRHFWCLLVDSSTDSSTNLSGTTLTYATSYLLLFWTIRRSRSLNTWSTWLHIVCGFLWFLHRIIIGCGMSCSRTFWAIRWQSIGSSTWLWLLKLIISLPGTRSIYDLLLCLWLRPQILFGFIVWTRLFFSQNEIIIKISHLTNRFTSSLI